MDQTLRRRLHNAQLHNFTSSFIHHQHLHRHPSHHLFVAPGQMAKAKVKSKAKTATAAKMATKATPVRVSPVSPPTVEADESVAEASFADTTRNDDDLEDESGMATPTGNDTLLGLGEDDDEDENDNTASASASNVVVCVRVRPAPAAASSSSTASEPWKLTDSSATIEATEQHPSIAKRGGSSSAPGQVASSASSSFLSEAAPSKTSEKDTYKFTFDSILPPSTSSLESLYSAHISPVVKGAVQGYNGTVFAYGQTGSGKTFTMSGGGGEKGIIGRAIDEVFESVGNEADREFLLRVSYLEIYNESLRDLLVGLPSSASMASTTSSSSISRPASPTKGGYSHRADGGTTLRIQEHPSSGRVTIAGLREELVTSSSDILSLLERGQAARHQAATDWNERSSRSHCVATITIESRSKEGGDGVRVSALNLIDLAGSERAATEKERRKEGAFINKSLLTLGSVISKLSASANNPAAAAHIPYRDSKLTRLLQTSLSGNARVAVLLTMSPLPQHAVEGLSTLKFGRRCKMIKLQARRGEIGDGDGASEALLRRYKKEVERLRARLEEPVAASTTASSSGDDDASLRDVEARRRAAEVEVEDMTRQKGELRAQMEHLTRLILTGKSVDGNTNPPSTPPRPRARVSEFGTPGTPSRPSSPHKRMAGGAATSMLSRSTSDSLEEAQASSSSSLRPFAKEAELASLRRNLTQALEAKARSEESLEKEVEAWQKRVADVKKTLEEREAQYNAAERERRATEEELRSQVQKLKSEGSEAARLGKGRDSELEELRCELAGLKHELGATSKRLVDAIAALDVKRREGEEELATQQAQHDAAVKDLYAQRRRLEDDLGSHSGRLAAVAAELEEERRIRQEVEAKLAKRPETDEEVVQSEFDELVKEARAKEAAMAPKSPSMAAAKTLSPDDGAARMREREARLEEREGDIEERRRQLAQRERQLRDQEVALAATVPPTCDHLAQIQALERQLSAERAKLQEARAANVAAVPPSPGRLREALATTPTKMTASTSSNGLPFSLHRGGSLREYRRYHRPTLASTPSSSAILPALSLVSSTSSSSLPTDKTPAPLLEAALRREREEVAKLNEVIQAQRSMMASLESSVAQWQQKMGEQQEIIKMLLDEAAAAGGKELLPTPPMGEDADAENIKPTVATASRARGLRDSTALRKSSGRVSNGATPPRQRAQPHAPASLPRSAAMKNDDFLKRRSAFLVDSPSSKDAKPRAGSMMPLGSGPYYGAHTFNRPPGSSSSNAGSHNYGLGLAAPSSPTKGSGLWSLASHGGPEPLPLPESYSTPTKSDTLASRRKRRQTIEHELAALKNGASPRVDERTRDLLESPKRGAGAGRFAEGATAAGASRDWYI